MRSPCFLRLNSFDTVGVSRAIGARFPGSTNSLEGESMKRFLSLIAVVCIAIPSFAAGPKKTGIVKAKNKIPGSYIVVLENRTEDVDGAANEMAYAHFG